MNIVKCPSCMKYVHVGKSFGDLCIYCAAMLNFSSVIENNLQMNIINDCESELLTGNFSAALKKYDESIEKFPNISMLYWGRFLTIHKCKSDYELIINGINFDTDPDYVNANRFASEAEKECYIALATTRSAIVQLILDSLNSSENIASVNTNIVSINKKAISEINELQDIAARQILELDAIEKSIRDKVADCDVFINAGKARIAEFSTKLEVIKNKINNLREATFDETEMYQTEMSITLSICSNEWNDMQSLNQKPQFVEYNSLLKKQKDAEQAVNSTIYQINQVNERLYRLVGTIGSIKTRYAEARTEINNGSFMKAKELLRDEVFYQITRNFVRV